MFYVRSKTKVLPPPIRRFLKGVLRDPWRFKDILHRLEAFFVQTIQKWYQIWDQGVESFWSDVFPKAFFVQFLKIQKFQRPLKIHKGSLLNSKAFIPKSLQKPRLIENKTSSLWSNVTNLNFNFKQDQYENYSTNPSKLRSKSTKRRIKRIS